MADKSRDVREVWTSRPEEDISVNIQEVIRRRTHELQWSTRGEVVASIAAAIFFAAVAAWRVPVSADPLLQLGLWAVAAWVAVSLWWFRRSIRAANDPAQPTAVHYRHELERRRDHLRNAWIWNGPMVLACVVFAGTLRSSAYYGPERLRAVLPLIAVLVLWTGYGIVRRLRAAREVQREIDELKRSG
jgi:hypothetical protein